MVTVAYKRWLLARGFYYRDLLGKFWFFGYVVACDIIMVACDKWLFIRGDPMLRFDCFSENIYTCSYVL